MSDGVNRLVVGGPSAVFNFRLGKLLVSKGMRRGPGTVSTGSGRVVFRSRDVIGIEGLV